jgi:hypothetical protein
MLWDLPDVVIFQQNAKPDLCQTTIVNAASA